jgi:hypothetical protein
MRIPTRRRFGVLVAVLTGLSVLVMAPPAGAQPLTYTFSVEQRGAVRSDLEEFRRVASSTLADRRGWTLGGSISFREVDDGGDLRLVLASPAEVDAAHEVCDAEWSCRVEDEVLINDERWAQGAPGYPLSIDHYRPYVINHEVGHWLGLGHEGCPGDVPAPVMDQQSKGLGTCTATVWPLDHERAGVAELHGVEVLPRGDTLVERLLGPDAARIGRASPLGAAGADAPVPAGAPVPR